MAHWRDVRFDLRVIPNRSADQAGAEVRAKRERRDFLGVRRLLVGLGGVLVVAAVAPLAASAAAPVNTVVPSVSGSEAEDATLSASNGSWSNSPTSYGYQWQRCSSYSAMGLGLTRLG
jgi:hypothetical protein